MKAIILAGGLPSTISDVKSGIPKPMAEIGGRPLIWHIMKLYSHLFPFMVNIYIPDLHHSVKIICSK